MKLKSAAALAGVALSIIALFFNTPTAKADQAKDMVVVRSGTAEILDGQSPWWEGGEDDVPAPGFPRCPTGYVVAIAPTADGGPGVDRKYQNKLDRRRAEALSAPGTEYYYYADLPSIEGAAQAYCVDPLALQLTGFDLDAHVQEEEIKREFERPEPYSGLGLLALPGYNVATASAGLRLYWGGRWGAWGYANIGVPLNHAPGVFEGGVALGAVRRLGDGDNWRLALGVTHQQVFLYGVEGHFQLDGPMAKLSWTPRFAQTEKFGGLQISAQAMGGLGSTYAGEWHGAGAGGLGLEWTRHRTWRP